MSSLFPEPILQLPLADMPVKGARAFLSQGSNHQIVFMQFSEDAVLQEHSHESQWGIVLEGMVELTVGGEKRVYQKGDRYFIPKGVKHSGRIFKGLAVIEYFNQKDRYMPRIEKDKE